MDKTDAIVATTQERIFVKNMMALLDYSHLVKAVVIARMCSKEKYYKLEGYETESDFIQERAGLSRRQGQKYKKIGQKFLEMFPLQLEKVQSNTKLIAQNVQSTAQNTLPISLSDRESFDKVAAFLSEVGLEKFYEMVRFDVDIQELANEEMVTLPNGDRISVEEIKLQSAKQLTLQLSDAQQDLENLNAKLRTERSRHEEEKKLLAAENDHLKKKMDEARELEKLYGGKAGKFSDKKQYLDDAYEYFDLFRTNFSKADIKPGDAETILERAATLLNLFKSEAQRYGTDYAELLEAQ